MDKLTNAKDSRFELRVPADLHAAFIEAARRNDRPAAQLVRDFMREYVRKNAQGDLLKGQ